MLKVNNNWRICAALVCLFGAGLFVYESKANEEVKKNVGAANINATTAADAANSVTVTDLQAKQVKVVAAQMSDFVAQSDAVGYIDFNQDNTVQVFTPYQGRIRQVFVKAGDDVKKGQPLFSVDSPDLVQAESTLITNAGLMSLTSKALERSRRMLETQASAQKDVDQAVSDQQAAEGNYKAARDAVRIFGKSDAEIDKIVSSRKIDGEMLVTSPQAGRVTARSAAPGLLVEPGNTPAPVTVADLSTMWLIANVAESDFSKLRTGQHVTATIMALPDRKFNAEIVNIGSSIDPGTHRIAVRSEIKDPRHELRPQMLASFQIRLGEASSSVGIPASGVVRESDGSMSIFVTSDGRRFTQRTVKLGMEQNGLVQIADGLAAGEKVASDGALFLSNAMALQTR